MHVVHSSVLTSQNNGINLLVSNIEKILKEYAGLAIFRAALAKNTADVNRDKFLTGIACFMGGETDPPPPPGNFSK
jgi:hypothetical protein